MEYAVIFLPLLGTIIGYLSKYFGDIASQLLTTLTVCVAAILSLVIFYNGLVYDNYGNYIIFEWIKSGNFQINWSINIDPLSSIMLVVVTLVSALVHIYSIGYMSHDPFKPRFMSYLSLFTFAMLVLVVSDNFIQLFFGWEGVGLSSYLLIGFWYKKESANKAAIKAFLVNRIGDFGLAIGIFLIFFYFGTLNYNEVFQLASNFSEKEINFLGLEANLITLISLFLFIGAMGKSAQFFLHTWLPDAMEGPTPVSALIHAATMVTAGVFLVVRCSPIFEYSQFALNIVTIIGMTTAFFAATVAIVQNDIKKIIAYSTCSQLGYMFFAAGIGAYHVAIFHLFTHAFFKALLFLGSGSVIHSLNDEQDIRIRYIYSQARLTGHDFLQVGTGGTSTTNWPDVPTVDPVPSQEITEDFPGRVFYVSTDQQGNFRVGKYFRVNQATGSATLNASAFDLSGLTSLRLGSIGAQLGAQINEFSTDGTMSQNSNAKVPTQAAIRTYVQTKDNEHLVMAQNHATAGLATERAHTIAGITTLRNESTKNIQISEFFVGQI